MLLIDGVWYKEWVPQGPQAEDEFEQEMKKHTQDIFGEQSIYLDMKTKLKSELGTSSIPDGFVIFFGDSPHWHIVEVELSWHPLHDHIISQVGRFISGIENTSTQKKIIDAVDNELARDDFLRLRLKKAIEPIEVYKFLSNLISKPPILTVIIEKETPGLREALRILNYPQIKVVEFRTFTREGIGLAVHAHLFEPLHERKKGERREIGWHGEGYTLVHIEGDHEVYEKDGEFSIKKLPHRKVVAQGLQSLEEALRWIRGGEFPQIEVKVTPAAIKYAYIPLPREYRHLFPGYKVPFSLITDIDQVTTQVTSAPAGTASEDPNAGRIIQGNLKPWYQKHEELKPGDKLLIEIIEPMKKYRLETLK